MEIGKAIKSYRKRKGISQVELALKSEISQTYLSQIENGTRMASIPTLERISMELNIPLPILSFLSLDINSVEKSKQDSFRQIQPSINAFIQEFFKTELQPNYSDKPGKF